MINKYLCRLPTTDQIYPIDTALECINAPKLTNDVFQQNQYTVEQLIQLYGFHDISRQPPSPFESTAVNIDETLESIRNEYESLLANNTEVNAFDYYSALSALYLTLKDPHTLFVKPQFYKNFVLKFPIQITNQNGIFYAKRFTENDGSYYQVSQKYQKLYGDFEFTDNEHIMKINGMEPIEWFKYMANKYDYSSKTDHGRLNSFLSGSLYSMRLDVYNMLEPVDRMVTIEYLSGLTETYRFVVSISTAMNSSDDANQIYNNEIHGSPYESLQKKQTTAQQRFFETMKREQIQSSILKLQDSDMQLLLSSPSFFNLYKYGDDYVIQITSFSPDSISQSLIDLLNLTDIIGNTTSKIFVDVRGNGGGWTSLGHIFANVLAHAEYPIYGQYNMRKSNISELLIDCDSEFEQMNRLYWISGKQLDSDWYQSITTNQNYTQYYTFDDDNDDEVYQYSKQLYNVSLNYNPNQIILISDSQCGSTCATFAAHLQEMSNCFSVLFAGADSQNYSVESFAGGNVQDSSEYEDSIIDSIINGWNGLNQSSIDYLTSLWLPHYGYQRFAHNMIYSFDPSKPAGTPDEYRLFPPNVVSSEILPSLDWQSQDLVKQVVDIAKTYEDTIELWYGDKCDSQDNQVFRILNGECVKHGCEFGYYRQSQGDDYICAQRTDKWLPSSENNSNNGLSGGAIAGIVIAVVVVVALIVFLLWWFLCRKQKYQKLQSETEQIKTELDA